jgi:hypothetical protein
MTADTLRSYRIKYDVHCKLENFFGKEIVVKNCYSEVHAKMKLGKYCEKHYKEFDFIKFISVTEEGFNSLFGDVFGNNFGDAFKDKNSYMDIIDNIRKKVKNKKK